MKLIREVELDEGIEKALALLRNNGIAVRLSKEKQQEKKPSLIGFRRGIWVLADEQYTDAKSLLRNPAHEVREVLSKSRRRELESEANRELGAASSVVLTGLRSWQVYAALLGLVFVLVSVVLFFYG